MAVPVNRKNLCTVPRAELATTTTLGTNWVANPNFEANATTGWAAGQNNTIAVQSTQVYAGTYALKVTRSNTTVTGCYAQYTFPTNLTAGTTYTVSFYARTDAAGATWNVFTGNPASAKVTFNPTTTWTRYSAQITYQTGDTALYITDDPTAAPVSGATLYLDNVMVEAGTTLNNYYDGNTPNVGGWVYNWTGTANLSTSTWTLTTVNGWSAGPQCRQYQDATLGTPTLPSGAALGTRNIAIYRTSTTVGAGFSGIYRTHAFTSGTTYTVSFYAAGGVSTANAYSFYVQNGGLAATTFTASGSSTWQRYSATFTATATGNFSFYITDDPQTAPAAGGPVLHVVGMMIEAVGSLGSYFDGSMPVDTNRYYWDGTADASTSEAEYRGVWIDVNTGSGAPSTQISVSGLGTSSGQVTVTRTADGETFSVPGWYNRNVVDTDTDADYAVPLGRTVTYTLFYNGQQINSQSVTVNSATGWVQDPLDPSTAMPINLTLTDRNILTMGNGSLKQKTHAPNAVKATVLGAKRPHSISGQRILDQGLMFILHAWTNTVSDQFKALTNSTILLFRGLPSWGSLPGLAYTDAPAQEMPVNRYQSSNPNNSLTQWSLSGDLIQPVTRPPVSGRITNDQVKTNLAGRTYDSIKAASGSKRYIDIKANPLGLGS